MATATATDNNENPNLNNNPPHEGNPTKTLDPTEPKSDLDLSEQPKPAPAADKDSAAAAESNVPPATAEAGSDAPLSGAQKKIRRAERFGITVQLSEKEKRNSRSERFGTSSTTQGSETSKSDELKRKARAERFLNKNSEMEEKGNQQESNAAASSTSGEPAIVIEGLPDIIASNSTIPHSDALSADPAIVIDGVPGIITNNGIIPPGDASSAESAIVINEAPDMIPSNRTLPSGDASSAAEMRGPLGLGKWLVGRKVRKWFKGKHYAGKVTKFDKWYRVLYEDGDSEDLDWQELEEVLVPSEGKVPLKKLAKRIIKENKISARKSGKNVAHSQISK